MAEERSLSELTAQLKAKYREDKEIARLFYPDHGLPIEQCYLHLALIDIEKKVQKSQGHQIEQGKFKQETREYFLHEYERIHYIQRKLKPEELLTECRQTPKRIYIEGAAGSGKTTLSQFIAYQWGKDHSAWKNFESICVI